MELFFNCVWALLALASLCLWHRLDQRKKKNDFVPLIALGLFIVLLFPVISVSDDLWVMQNPVEADCCVRRDSALAASHAFLLDTAFPSPVFSGIVLRYERLSGPVCTPLSPVNSLAEYSLQNRPPPTA